MNWKKVYHLVFIVVVGLALYSCSAKSRLASADKKFEAGEYATALAEYSRVYSKIPYKEAATRSRVAFNQAECLRAMNHTRYEMMYSRAIRFDYPDSLVFLRYAQAQHRNGKYAEAAKNYRLYLEYDSASVLAHNGLKAIEMIPRWKAEPTYYKVSRDRNLYQRNSYNFNPVYQGDAYDQLFFTSNRAKPEKGVLRNFVNNQPNNNIYFIKKDVEGKWSKPEAVFPIEFSDNKDIGAASFSPDGRTMYFTRANQQEDGGAGVEIVFSSRVGGEWTEPQRISIYKDSTIAVAHPAIAPDGETIYFVSDAPNGYGGKDIWKGTLSGAECKFITNLGPQINTPGDEVFPVVRADGTLYFSSDGLPGLGGLDLFKATLLEEDNWLVENLGIPLNSNYDDFAITFEGEKEAGFLSSNRGQSRGWDIIYQFELPVVEVIVEGTVVDDKQVPIPDALVRLVSNTGMNVRVSTKKDGSYRIRIDADMDCVMLGTARGFLNSSASVSSKGVKESKTYKVNMELPAIFRPVQMDNIFYEFAKWNLTKESEAGLQELLKIMNDNPNVTIEISAHTDYVGNNEANQVLSQRRAQSVVDYLINAGIEQERLVSVGHGEEKPFVVDQNTFAKYNFLPLDTILTEEFILGLEREQQAVANQINRRTEFKVLKMNYKLK